MTWKSYVAVSGAGLLATYLVSTPPAELPQRTSAARTAAVARPAEPAVDIQDEAARLQARQRDESQYREPSRNPFRFDAQPAAPRRAAPPADPVPEPPMVTPVEPAPQPPLVRLSGIATDTVDGVRERRAILITEQGVVNAGEGDAVGTEYRVARIDADAVELVAPDGTVRRISLRP